MTEKKPLLSHSDGKGGVRMVDVTEKATTLRRALARGSVVMAETTRRVLERGSAEKGSVLSTAELAGIMAAKRTASLIPLCHTLPLEKVSLSFSFAADKSALVIESCCSTHSKTGVEMEALVAVSVAALTVYDMLKSIDRAMRIDAIRLLEKSGGRSGTWRRQEEEESGGEEKAGATS